MNILLVASSKHGSTDEVAAVIAEQLRQAGINVDVAHPEDVTSVDGYDGCVVGSAVYMAAWTPEAVAFCERFRHELESRPVWAFSVGLSGVTKVKGKATDPQRVGPVLLSIEPEDHFTFAGKLDPTQLNLRERSIARLGGASEGDYRDWETVRTWAQAIATSLISMT